MWDENGYRWMRERKMESMTSQKRRRGGKDNWGLWSRAREGSTGKIRGSQVHNCFFVPEDILI